MNHYVLPELAPNALNDEITGSKISLEQLFKCQVTAFCCPHGAWNRKIKEHVKRAGYHVACAISAKSTSVTDDPWALRRIKIKDSDSLGDFRRKVSNWYLTYRAWRNR